MNLLSSITNKLSGYIPSFKSKQESPKPIPILPKKDTNTKSKSKKKTNKKKSSTKKGIPKTIRNQVWRKYCGNKLDAKCFSCDQTLSYECWEAGHVLAETNGGETCVDNLRPICLSCNRSMGKMHMFEFMKKYQLSGVKNIK